MTDRGYAYIVSRTLENTIAFAEKTNQNTLFVTLDVLKDILALLKEQVPVKPTWSLGKPFCGACGLRIRSGKYCSECGKPILWEGR